MTIREHPAFKLTRRGIFIKLKIKTIFDSQYIFLDNANGLLQDKEKEEKKLERTFVPKIIQTKFKRLAANANTNLENHGFKTDWGIFVPLTAFKSWFNNNEEIRNDFFEVLNDLCINYDKYLNDIKHEYLKFATDVWNDLYPNSGPPTETFVYSLVNDIVNKLPTKTDIMGSVQFDTIPIPVSFDFMLVLDESQVSGEEINVLKKEFVQNTSYLDSFYDSTVSSFKDNIAKRCSNIIASMNEGPNKKRPFVPRKHQKYIVYMISLFNRFAFYDDDISKTLMKDLKEEIFKPIEIMSRAKTEEILNSIIAAQINKKDLC